MKVERKEAAPMEVLKPPKDESATPSNT